METKTTIEIEQMPVHLDYWTKFPIDDLVSLKFIQKVEQFIDWAAVWLQDIDDEKKTTKNQYFRFDFSLSLRNFSILLRDSLLAIVKVEQYTKDRKPIKDGYENEIYKLLREAAQEVANDYNKAENATRRAEWVHQTSPVQEIINQLKELEKQCKKIVRSGVKVDNIRLHITEYLRDFHLQYSIQSNAVKQVFTIVDEIKDAVKDISSNTSASQVEKTVDIIGEHALQLELVQSTESIEILPYANNETLSIPTHVEDGNIIFKTINIKSEFARWFSSFIYPKIIELESKRDHAVEKCLLAFTQIRTRVAAISLAEVEESFSLQKDFKDIFAQLEKDVLTALKKEEEDTDALIETHEQEYLLASNVYLENRLFLPESGGNQISNLSKDAQRRITHRFEKYRGELKSYVNKVLSQYVEVDKTPYSRFIKNQTSIYDEDDSLALFLKKGYLGKSFTVPRPELIDPIVEDYRLWLEGFSGALLMSGLSGSGKSTLLGMINHMGWSAEIIQLKTGESYFIEHESYNPEIDFKVLIDNVLKRTKGKRIVISIDDLEMWHDAQVSLYDNISKLFRAILKYRQKVFFVVTCTPFLRQRIQSFMDLNTVFSHIRVIDRMNSNQIRSALNLRARVHELANIEDLHLDAKFSNIVRNSRGNIGAAMMEYCRYHNESYQHNVKSQEFIELIRTHHVFLKYICAFQHCSIKMLSITLAEMDFRRTMKTVDYLVGQKVLVRPKKGYVAINPLLIHNVERTLLKMER